MEKKGKVDNYSLVERYGIDSHPEYEPDEPEWLDGRPWVQGEKNQAALLDAFFGALKPERSLIFTYAKRTPLVDDGKWMLVGVGRITTVGKLQEWDYDPPKHDRLRSYLWERSVCHTIRPDGTDGVLLPYHDLLDRCAKDPKLDPSPFMAPIPDAYRKEFLLGSEHVSSGSAIAALLSVKTALTNYDAQFGGDWSNQFKWIDRQLGQLWTMRGPYPGMGSVLCAMGVEHGYQLAYHCWEQASENGDPWPVLAEVVQDQKKLPGDLREQVDGFRDTWAYYCSGRRTARLIFSKLLARFDITLPQAMRWWDQSSRSNAGIALSNKDVSDAAIVKNPYVLYECDRDQPEPIAFEVIDQGAFPEKPIALKHPLSAPSKITGAVDGRRLRAATTAVLEEAASDGHTLMSRADIIADLLKKPLNPTLPATDDQFKIHADKLGPVLTECNLENGEPAYQLNRLAASCDLISIMVRRRIKHGKRHNVEVNWLKKLDAEFKTKEKNKNGPKGSTQYMRRMEKASALKEMAASRFSVLIGPAGTGKTTLLKVLCKAKPISKKGILLLAPTGKARVRLQFATKLEAKTLAQFLRPHRYNEETQRYSVIGKVERNSAYKTVIVDEASMLTEEQLAALLDSLSNVERIILVGDPSQLPPIGAGRPFVDIIKFLQPDGFTINEPKIGKGFAELTIGSRQKGKRRPDLELAELFSGRQTGATQDEIIPDFSDGTDFSDRKVGKHLKICSWSTPDSLTKMLPEVIGKQLKLDSENLEQSFAVKALGGKESRGTVYFNFWESESAADKWQILSPIKGEAAGTVALNRLIQQGFRGKTKREAAFPDPWWSAKVPSPKGGDGIIYGDKVINIANHHRRWVFPKKPDNGTEPLCYVANGEIGIVTGPYKKKGKVVKLNNLKVTFSTQLGYHYTYWNSDLSEDKSLLEFAYALTVHKAQGSEFDTVYVVIPNPCRILSRELLYTALTRQKKHLVLFCQGDPRELLEYRHLSDTARRLTNLFEAPEPVQIGQHVYDSKHIHMSRNKELMISKSEVIIANELSASGIEYDYELPFVGSDGSRRYPDFTIEDPDTGVTWLWEHLGMLGNAEYDKKWESKQKWYRKNGVKPAEEGGGEIATLITTTETNGIDHDQIADLISRIKDGT